MRIYHDLDSGLILQDEGFSRQFNELNPIVLKRGDTSAIEIGFVRGLSNRELLEEGAIVKVGMKEVGKFEGDFIVFGETNITPSEDDRIYRIPVNLNTIELNNLIMHDGDATNDLEFVDLIFEISIEINGEITSSLTSRARVYHDVISGNEGIPVSGNPAYPSAITINDAIADVANINTVVSNLPLNVYNGTGPPVGINDQSEGYSVGSIWIDSTSSPRDAYRCVDASTGSAVWELSTLTIDELSNIAVTGNLDDAIQGTSNKFVTQSQIDAWNLAGTYEEFPQVLLYTNSTYGSGTATIDVTALRPPSLGTPKSMEISFFASVDTSNTIAGNGSASIYNESVGNSAGALSVLGTFTANNSNPRARDTNTVTCALINGSDLMINYNLSSSSNSTTLVTARLIGYNY